uniref:Ig-like domain-containing protein n=1 Tax=Angiostrongylus cantonensis TaxID=6313 RepID=A0A0K0DL63_ANGCA
MEVVPRDCVSEAKDGQKNGMRCSCVSDEVLVCLRQEQSKLENPVQNVITVVAHEPAYLHCKIPEGTHHMVAWTRTSDQALLTAGHHSFTSDPRFQVSKKSDTDWILILSGNVRDSADAFLKDDTRSERLANEMFARSHDDVWQRAVVRDTGCYLCEVNTEPFSTIYAFYLDVQGELHLLVTPTPGRSIPHLCRICVLFHA